MIEFFKEALVFLYTNLMNIVFPSDCLLCGKMQQEYLCSNCYKKLKQETIFRIEKNRKQELYFDKFLYAFSYENIIKQLLIQFKFQDKSYLYRVFAKILIKNRKLCSFLQKYDIIMPVPIHKKRKAQRGYNQSELICKELIRLLQKEKKQHIQLEMSCLKKIKYNVPQSTLNRKERMENVKNVYVLDNQEKIRNKNIILLDDIYTTGSTVNACAKLLKENGANKILIVTIAKD